jgi:hypothetical protein
MKTKYIPLPEKIKEPPKTFVILPYYCEKCLTKVWFEWVTTIGIFEKCPDCGGDLWNSISYASKNYHKYHRTEQ